MDRGEHTNCSDDTMNEEIDERLYRAWEMGDEKAFNKIWCRLWLLLKTVAFNYALSFAPSDSYAKDWADEAFFRVIEEIKKNKEKITWLGERSFVAYVKKRLIWRLQDVISRETKLRRLMVSLIDGRDSDEEEPEPIEFTHQGIEPDKIPEWREEIKAMIEDLGYLYELLARSQALQETVGGILDYLKSLMVELVPEGVNTKELSFEDLIEITPLELLQPDKSELYQYLMNNLNIGRNALDQRMKLIRKRWGKMRLQRR
jgi:hypothetical protein